MDTELINLLQLPTSPWRNGAGTTRDIARAPLPTGQSGPAGFLWRLSLADLDADSVFSELPGVDRIFTIVSAGAVTLTVNGDARLVDPGEPQRFRGEDPVSVALGEQGPQKALNLMTARGRAWGEVTVQEIHGEVRHDDVAVVAVVVLSGSIVVADGQILGQYQAVVWPEVPYAIRGDNARIALVRCAGSAVP